MEGYLVSQALKLLKIHRNTLYRYEAMGLITPRRDHNNWRRYDPQDLIQLSEKINGPPENRTHV